ncbi:MAG: DNA internalization-related competence protein ComEC/Rec2 [Bacteroidaceae bacterium]|nr:DNA internalization-related competence protein ComEC/Rec2 [Bacteroidaceae bacterium]
MDKVKRPLGGFACVLVMIIALSAFCIPEDILGVRRPFALAESFLTDGEMLDFEGFVYHKENKAGGQVIYYLRDATLSNGKASLSQVSFFISLNDDRIPIFSKVCGSGKTYCFGSARNEGNFDEKNYYYSLGLVCGVKKCQVDEILPGQFSWLDGLYGIRKSVAEVYLNILPSEESGLLSAIALGEKSDLDAKVKDMFLGAGIVHILAVSGLHISLICMGLYRILKGRGFSFAVSGGLASFVAVMYVIMAGMSVSSLRAGGMFLIYMLSQVLGENYDMATSLGVMAILLLVKNPMYITNTGFVFSFCAMASVLFVARPLGKMYSEYADLRKESKVLTLGLNAKHQVSLKDRALKGIFSSLIFSFGITLGMLGVTCYLNYQFPVVSVGLNFLLLPFLPALLGFGLAGGITGCFWSGFGEILLMPCHVILYTYEWIADKASLMPGAVMICGKPTLCRAVIYTVLQILLVRIVSEKRLNPLKAVMAAKNEAKNRLVFTVIMMTALTLIVLIPSRTHFEVDVLDVGQGDGIFIRSDEGVNFFIDGGSTNEKQVGKYRILPFLKYKGAGKIDYWFVTHTDEDHVSGLIELLNSGYRVKNIVLSPEAELGDSFELLIQAAEDTGCEISVMKEGDFCGTKSLKFVCLGPEAGCESYLGAGEVTVKGGEEIAEGDANASSLVLMMGYDSDRDKSFFAKEDEVWLFTGDIGSDQEKKLVLSYGEALSKVDCLKVAHHGSRYSSCNEFLEAVGGGKALISCGERNSYGHPHQAVLERLAETGFEIRRTDKEGQLKTP